MHSQPNRVLVQLRDLIIDSGDGTTWRVALGLLRHVVDI